jgi:hypothetical protein
VLRRLSLLLLVASVVACSGNSSNSSPASTAPSASNLCSFSLPPGTVPIGVDGGGLEIPLTTQAGCAWNSDALDFLSRPSADSTGTGPRTFHVDVPKNVGGRRQGRFRIQGFAGTPFTNTFVNIVTQDATIDQAPLVVPVPSAPSYFYYAAPYPSWGGVTRLVRNAIDGTLQIGGVGQSRIEVAVLPLGGNSPQVTVSIGAPQGQTLQVGTYENALRLPTDSNPSVDITVGSQGCNQTFGRFTVQDVSFMGVNGSGITGVGRLRASFEVGCESMTAPRTVGEVWYVLGQ